MNPHRSKSKPFPVIRVLVVNITGVVLEMVQQNLQNQSDMQLMGCLNESEEIDSIISEVDILIMGVEDVYSLPANCFQLLRCYPRLKILLLTITQNEAIAYWLDLHCRQLQVISSQTLIESIRQVYSLTPFLSA